MIFFLIFHKILYKKTIKSWLVQFGFSHNVLHFLTDYCFDFPKVYIMCAEALSRKTGVLSG